MLLLFLLILFLFSIVVSPTCAEITLDNTLYPNTHELTGPDYKIGAELGQQHGSNLFHSFKYFSLSKSERVTFSGDKNIDNIINRVTGKKASYINGLIHSTIPEAQVYLINPMGIFFGPYAALDIQGSFHASTADVLHLQDGGSFNARQPSASVLTVAPVEGFGFLTETPADITVQGSRLSVPAGQDFSLIGGKLHIDSEKLPVYREENDTFVYSTALSASSGRFNLASLANKGRVTPTPTDLKLSGQPGYITLKNTKLDTSGEGGGAVYIRAGQLVLDSSRIEAKTLGAKNGKKIDIQADDVSLVQGSRLDGASYGAGNGSDIEIQASNSIEVTGDNGYPLLFDGKRRGNSEISAFLLGTGQFSPTRQGGQIYLKAKQLLVTEGAMINTGGYSNGESGSIKIQVNDLVEVSGEGGEGIPSMIFSAITEEEGRKNEGKSGSIEIIAGRLLVDKAGQVFASTGSLSSAGDLKIQVSDTLTISGVSRLGFASFVGSASIPNSASDLGVAGKIAGKGGNVWIEAGKIFLEEGGMIDVGANAPEGTQSQGSGHIIIRADIIKLSGVNTYGENRDGLSSGIYARSRGSKAGPAGSISIRTDALMILEGATIASDTSSDASGGKIDISVDGPLIISGSSANITLKEPALSQQIFKQTFPNHQEKTAYSGIYASSSGTTTNSGQAGEITISTNTIELTQGGTINTSTNNAGGGHITITVPSQLYLKQGGEVTTSVQGGKGDGGNITIQDPVFVILNKGQIKAQAEAGRGGNIHIKANNYFKSSDSTVNASSKLGVDGQITIDSPDETLSNALIVLSDVLVKDNTLVKSCKIEDESRFIVEHMIKGQVPAN